MPKDEDAKLLSALEAFLYFLFLMLFIFLYNKIQTVPFHKDTIVIERIPLKDNNHPQDSISTHVKADISFRMPMTYVYDEKGLGLVNIKMKILKNGKGELITESNTHDSLRSEFKSIFNKLPESDCFIYSCIKEENSIFNKLVGFKGYDPEIDSTNYVIRRNYQAIDNNKRKTAINEAYSFPYPVVKHEISDKDHPFVSTPLSRPNLLSPYDISQSYFEIQFDGNVTPNSLSYDFVGAIELSYIYPEPDIILLGRFEYYSKKKIEIIQKNGLKFHTRYKELENRQNFRLFFLSAILSALSAIFLTFLVISLYKISRLFKKSENTRTRGVSPQ